MGAGYSLKIRAAAKEADIFIYEDIGEGWMGGISANQFKDDLAALDPGITTINLHINSFGGDVFDGLAIYRLLVDHKARVITFIDGFAASIASVIAMAGNEIRMAEAGFIMIHNAQGMCMGEADDMDKMAAVLRTVTGSIGDVYVSRTGVAKAQITSWMDEEHWFDSRDAMENGFCDEMMANMQMAAAFDPRFHSFRAPPPRAKAQENAKAATLAMRSAAARRIAELRALASDAAEGKSNLVQLLPALVQSSLTALVGGRPPAALAGGPQPPAPSGVRPNFEKRQREVAARKMLLDHLKIKRLNA